MCTRSERVRAKRAGSDAVIGCTGQLDADEMAIDQFGTMPDHSGEFAQTRRNRHGDTEREMAVHQQAEPVSRYVPGISELV